MTLSVFAIIISVVIGIINIGAVIYRGGKMAADLEALKKRHEQCPINTVMAEIEKLKAKNEVFWSIITPHLGNIIHSPDHKRRDELVDKLIYGQITSNELRELGPMLDQEANNGVKEKRLPSAFLLARVKILLINRGEYA